MKRYSWIVAFSALIVSGCCVSETPLADIEKSQPDDELFGKWIADDPKDDPRCEPVFIGRVPKEQESKSPMQICGAGTNPETKTVTAISAALYPMRIGRRNYATIALPRPVSVDPGDRTIYCIVKYEVTDNTLTVWCMDSGKLASDIDKGTIKGVVVKRALKPWGVKITASVRITDTADNLTKYISDTDDRLLFPIKITYTKLPDADP